MKRVALFLVFVTFILQSCSVGSKLSRAYKGKDFEVVKRSLGQPTSSLPAKDGSVTYYFVKKVHLKAAPINTGQFQYDRFDSPAVNKIEETVVEVNPQGIVKEVRWSSRYE